MEVRSKEVEDQTKHSAVMNSRAGNYNLSTFFWVPLATCRVADIRRCEDRGWSQRPLPDDSTIWKRGPLFPPQQDAVARDPTLGPRASAIRLENTWFRGQSACLTPERVGKQGWFPALSSFGKTFFFYFETSILKYLTDTWKKVKNNRKKSFNIIQKQH